MFLISAVTPAKKFFSFLTLISLFTIQSYCQVNAELSAALQHTLDSVKTSTGLVGVSAAIVMPDKRVWTGASGISHSGVNITTDMLFGIGSITKTFTTAIIMRLAAENKLSLDDSIYKWLPHYQYIDSTITIRHLLAHTSGIYNYTNAAAFWSISNLDLTKRYTPEEILSFVSTPSFTKGISWEYSNTNFILLGMIINKITGTSFNTQLHNRLTIPLNLNNTFIDVEDTITGNIADAWSDINGNGSLDNFSLYPRTAIYSGAWTAGGMFSTSADIAMWARLLYGGEVVDQKYLDQMTTFSAISGFFYGLGTMRTTILNKEWQGHSGGIVGYNSYSGYSKQDNISIAVLVNRDNANLLNVVTPLLKQVLEFKPVGIDENLTRKPDKFYLDQNYPNPFNPETIIKYSIAEKSNVQLKVYDLTGREITMLINSEKSPGNYQVKFSGSNLGSGIYFYTIKAGNYFNCRKMLLVK